MGLEPTTSELEVQRAIRCATAAMMLRKTQILSNPNKFFVREKVYTQTLGSNVTSTIGKTFKIQSNEKMIFRELRHKVCVFHEKNFFAKTYSQKYFFPNCQTVNQKSF